MKEEDKNYCIYKVQNGITGEVYIGATTNSIHQRYLDHSERANRGEQGQFYTAISTYGADAFSWKQIDTASSVDELAQLEKKYILEYNSKDEGYNGDSGGGFKKSVYQYNLDDGSLVETFDCLQNASSAVNGSKQDIGRACLNVNNTYSGYFWSYEYKQPFTPNLDERRKGVLQLDFEGNMIVTFNSVSEASLLTGINKSSIAKVCRNERKLAGGFCWKY